VMSPIEFQFRCRHVPNDPILTYGDSLPQCLSFGLTKENDTARRNGETVNRGRYTTRCVAMRPGAQLNATMVSQTALTEHFHSDGTIPPGWKYFLLFCQLMLLLNNVQPRAAAVSNCFRHDLNFSLFCLSD
jgi:hypothetical protein